MERTMIKYRLDKAKIEAEMEKAFLSHSDLARKLKWSRSLLSYAINRGSKSFAPKIAKALGITDANDIVVSIKDRAA
jgi:hypothetical protein